MFLLLYVGRTTGTCISTGNHGCGQFFRMTIYISISAAVSLERNLLALSASNSSTSVAIPKLSSSLSPKSEHMAYRCCVAGITGIDGMYASIALSTQLAP